MPVRARSSPEVEQNGVGFEARNRISRAHASIPSEPYNGSESLSLGRRPEKRRKADGLNTRLSRMLLRVNASFIADLPAPGVKRPRNPSDGSSSSTVGHEIPQTPVDAIHSAVKSKSLGDGFTIIKAGSSPDKGRSGFLANKGLPSWRDADQKRGIEKETRQRDLPSWLSQTFSALEPNHPLRALAFTDYSNSALDNNGVSAYQEPLEPPGMSRLEETQAETVFAFVPPDANSMVGEVAPATMLAVNQLDIDRFSAAEATYDAVGETGSFDLPANGSYVDDHLPADDAIYDKVQDTAEEFLPFTQPGPFARKTVHFLSPVRSTLLSVSNPSSNRSQTHSVVSLTEPNHRQTTCEPFATPGPTSRFVALNHAAAADSMNTQTQSSDSLTLADDSVAEDDVFADTNGEEDPAVSFLSFNSNSKHLQNKPFSTPGPVFCAPPVVYFNSPTEDPDRDPEELACDGIEREIEQMLSDGQLGEVQNTMRFIAREHIEMAHGAHEPVVPKSAASSTIGYPGQDELYIADGGLASDRPGLNDKLDTFNNEERAMSLMPPEAELVTNSQAAIQLFSSPPYIRFSHMKGHKNEATVSSPPEPFTMRKRRSPDLASTYMRFDRLPSPAGAAYHGANDMSALPCTPPRSQPPQQETRGLTEYDTNQAPGSASTNNLTFTGARVPTPATKRATPKQQKQRRAFAPGPGIYLSPLCDADEEEERNSSRNDVAKRDANDNVARQHLMKSKTNEISPSQASDDSIENWET